jgi:hypothetical protein
MDMKKIGFADKMIFILGVILAGVFAFVILMGVIVALFKYYLDNKKEKQSTPIRSIYVEDEQVMELKADPFEQILAEAVQLHEEVITGKKDRIQEAYRLFEQLRKDYPGQPIFKAYHGSIIILLAKAEENSVEKQKLTKRGLRLLEEAVNASSQDSNILELRSFHTSKP